MTASRDISLLSATEFNERITSNSILVQPLGAVEQHGPHLPLATDSIIAEAVALQAVELAVRDGLDVWLLPTLSYTKSNEHAWSSGTVWLSASTMQAVLFDLGRSISSTPCRKLVFLNGHGGNSSLVSMMNRELRLQYDLITFLAHPSLPVDQGGGKDDDEVHDDRPRHDRPRPEHGMGIHGGHDETSLMLHLRPDLVDMTRARRSIPDHLVGNRHVRFGGRVQFGWLSSDFGESGVIGDPEGATAAHGARCFESAAQSFCEALHEIDRYEIRGG